MVKAGFVVVVLLAAVGLGAAAPYETPNPDSDQIIESLRPRVTRGIRPTNPVPSGPAGDVTSSGLTAGAPPAVAPPPASSSSGWTQGPPALNPPQQTASNPAPAAEPPEPPPSVNLTVQFATGSAALTPAAVHTLDDLGKAMTSPVLAGFRFRIEGHTDTVGSQAANQALSEARAAKTLEYLAGRWGVRRDRVETVGMGEDGLLVPTGPNVAEPRNRRVTVINLGS